MVPTQTELVSNNLVIQLTTVQFGLNAHYFNTRRDVEDQRNRSQRKGLFGGNFKGTAVHPTRIGQAKACAPRSGGWAVGTVDVSETIGLDVLGHVRRTHRHRWIAVGKIANVERGNTTRKTTVNQQGITGGHGIGTVHIARLETQTCLNQGPHHVTGCQKRIGGRYATPWLAGCSVKCIGAGGNTGD